MNECGVKPRPCEHRCMNTFGSYMCYCLNGYMLTQDGSCTSSRSCSLAHCQYGCEEVEGGVRCNCPSSGLKLSSDGRTCEDVDECASGQHQCSFRRECVNTFGSYLCKCRGGYELRYLNGKYDCADVNECLSSTSVCHAHAHCVNTDGSYSCRCKPGYRGNGIECSVIPDPPPKFRILSGKSENAIPEPSVTQLPKLRLQPFDYDGEVYIGLREEGPPTEGVEPRKQEEGGAIERNHVNGVKLKPRGDVFFAGELYRRSPELREMMAAPLQQRFLTDCGFDSGECEWVQDQSDDLDWTVHYHDNGVQYYMALSGQPVGHSGNKAHLKLLLTDAVRQRFFCLKFSYRITGTGTGSLRVLVHSGDEQRVLWEEGGSTGDHWITENVDVTWRSTAPDWVLFEGRCEEVVSSEVGLDHVLLISGSCSDSEENIY